jgi:hypothetical protein
MKKLSFLTLAVIALLAFSGCTKKDSNSSTTSTNWTILGTTYTGSSTIVTSGGISTLIGADVSSDVCTINFSTVPTASGTYTIAVTPDATHCSAGAYVAATSKTYAATNGTISVTVSGGKVTAVINGIQVIDNTNNITTINGTLVQL